MDQSRLRQPFGAKHKKKRVGRGDGSGHGTYSGKGCKGQKSRSGRSVHIGFEGGQLPIIKRLPRKRGFVNRFRKEYSTINVNELNVFNADGEVTLKELLDAGLVTSDRQPVKILGNGTIDRPLTVKANKFSSAAEEKIVAAGGRVEKL